MEPLPPQYIAKEHEDQIYKQWEASGAFGSQIPLLPPLSKGEHKGDFPTFSMVMPPPNVTGTLHLGHAVMLALEDIMVRYHRMKGDATVWIPGTDHASIATQTVVEKKLLKEQEKSRHDLGREAFLAEVEKFVSISKDRIKLQVRKMGASCDWTREAYTLDEQRSLAVRTAFKMLYDKGLLYRGNRIVNWCPRCASTLADDEVEYKEEKTPFYYFKYGPVVIGTARPETKFQDKVIVVHPQDARYTHLHGKEFEVEWIEGPVMARVIADSVIDPKFGTGVMTITPAHSFEDFALAQKYKLPVTLIIDERGKLTEAAGSFAGQKARTARAEIVAKLQAKGLVEKIDESYVHNLSVCYRCGTAVEPLPKLQWFMDVNKKFSHVLTGNQVTLKQLMQEAVEGGSVTILPDRFKKVYFEWINNLRDWCVSRQIWFGHRIPVWYRLRVIPSVVEGSLQVALRDSSAAPQNDMEVYVGIDAPEGQGWEQDPDTLDTWFSSGLWTFSTLGWPKKTKDLELFHPTSVLETGYDIVFFWVARMILMSTALLGEVPFKTVYLHGLVRDMKGKKMSKSLGNVIDPLDMIEKYGADAVRVSLFMGTAAGTDVKLNEQKIAGYRNFANKIWNATRFVLMNLDEGKLPHLASPWKGEEPHHPSPYEGEGSPVGDVGTSGEVNLSEADQQILSELHTVVQDVTDAIEKFDFNRAGDTAYHYFWHTFCDKTIEAMKPRLQSIDRPERSEGSQDRAAAQYILYTVLTTSLKLLHPFMPFVTEALWAHIPQPQKTMLIQEKWPIDMV